jgi:hypothetical protein
MTSVLTGLFKNGTAAASAVDQLVASGVNPDDISVIATETVGREEFGIETKSRMAEGAAIGAGSVGGIAALAAGFLGVGVLASSGVGLIAAGPVIAALSGAGAGAATGGVLGGLVGLGISAQEIKFYEDAIDEGAVLVGVQTEGNDEDEINRIFENSDATKVTRA